MSDIFSEQIKKIGKFLQAKGKRILFYHRDADGVCSAALMMLMYPDMVPVPRTGPSMEEKFVSDVIKQRPDLVVFLDMPVDQEWEKIEKIKKQLPETKILIIDHHIPEKNLNSGNVVHFNPKFKKDVYLPASYLVYRILEKIEKDVKEFIWIACMGVIGDYGFDECKDLLKECKKAYHGLLGDDPFKSKLGRGVELISAAITLKGVRGANNALETLLTTDSYGEFANSKELNEWKKIVNKEFDDIIKNFEAEEKKARKNKSNQVEVYPKLNLIIYILDTKLSMTSAISSNLAIKNPDKTIMIVKRSDDEWKISMRNQSGKVNLNEIVKKAVKGIGSGGGHIKAAGAFVNDFEEFKKRFVNGLSSK